MKRNIAIILVILLAVGAYIGYSMFNKKHINVEDTKPEVSLSAADLFTAFENDETASMEKYADKVIAVSGDIYNVDLSNNLEPQLVLEANGDNGFIRCGFKTEELNKVKDLQPGMAIELKGECKGMNAPEGLDLLADIDVVLSNCIIID
ncbi:MAG: hypothetical protein RLZZ337_1211 [Bacteroidota bacterium]|jgi:hypothetical protein